MKHIYYASNRSWSTRVQFLHSWAVITKIFIDDKEPLRLVSQGRFCLGRYGRSSPLQLLQCVVVCCSVLQRAAGWPFSLLSARDEATARLRLYPSRPDMAAASEASACTACCSVVQCVAVRCSAVQCGAVSCSVLQCVLDPTFHDAVTAR